MHTQCPRCRTIFNVTEQILAVKAGLVRCGDCENVFNATWNLVDDDADEDSVEPSGDSMPLFAQPHIRRAIPRAAASRRSPADSGEESVDDEFFDQESENREALVEESSVGEDQNDDEDSDHAIPQDPDWKLPNSSVFDDDTDTDPRTATFAYDDDANERDTERDFDRVYYDQPDDEAEEIGDEEIGDEEISDEEIRRTLGLDHDFGAHLSGPQPDDDEFDGEGGLRGARPVRDDDSPRRAGLKSGTTARIEPRLDAGPAGLSVSADDALLPRRTAPGSTRVADRMQQPKRPAIQLKTPRGASPERVEPQAEKPYRPDPNVHWVSIPENDRRGFRFLWTSGVLLLLVVLVLQVRFFLVEELYAIPGTRPYISLFCQFAGCAAPVRSDPGAIQIVQTRVDLHPEVPGAVRINVNLINRADFAQPYPALQLTLSDVEGRIVGRRTYEPADYLGNRNDVSLLDAGILAVASINLAHPAENAVGFETEVVASGSR